MTKRLDYTEWTVAEHIQIRAQAGGGGIFLEKIPAALKAADGLELAAAITEAANLAQGAARGKPPASGAASGLDGLIRNRHDGEPVAPATAQETADVATLGGLAKAAEQTV